MEKLQQFGCSHSNTCSHLTSLSRDSSLLPCGFCKHTQMSPYADVQVPAGLHVSACSSPGSYRCPPRLPVLSRHQEELALPRQVCKSFINSQDHWTLTEETVKAHFQIRTLIDIKNIYTCTFSRIYHTTLIKSGFWMANASVPFESVHVFLTYRFVREQYGTERASGPT